MDDRHQDDDHSDAMPVLWLHILLFDEILNSAVPRVRMPILEVDHQQEKATLIQQILQDIDAETDPIKKLLRKADLHYLKEDFIKAVHCADELITLEPSERFYSLRAKFHHKLKNYERALEDLARVNQKTITTDHQIRSLLLSGRCLAELCKRASPAEAATKAEQVWQTFKRVSEFPMAKLPVRNKEKLKMKSTRLYFKSKKMHWFALRCLKVKEVQGKIKEFKANNVNLSEMELKQKIGEFEKEIPQPGTVPSEYICPISHEVMLYPQVTSAGQAYEKENIQNHIQLNKKSDPITREEILETTYDCNTLRQLIWSFLENHPWAFEHNNQDYTTFEF